MLSHADRGADRRPFGKNPPPASSDLNRDPSLGIEQSGGRDGDRLNLAQYTPDA